MNVTFFNKRLLQNDTEGVVEWGVPRRYRVDLNVNSGYNRTYRGKLVEENVNANGPATYFKEIASNINNEIKVVVTYAFSKQCAPVAVPVDAHGIFEFKMPILNQSVPYTMKVSATHKKYTTPVVFDYFVGGFPRTDTVEMGTYAFYTPDNASHNVTGRLFDAFTNRTFANDFSITVYAGYGEFSQNYTAPNEKLDVFGNGDYYTGFYELYDLQSGAYSAVVESTGYIKNFQRFYALPSPPFPKQMRGLPVVPVLEDGELALVLTWGYSPRDLDIHVEFVTSPTVLCKCDYSMHRCGGVKYMTDTVQGGDRGADVIKFDYVGDFQYIVYVSLFKNHRSSPKATNQTAEVSLAESQA